MSRRRVWWGVLVLLAFALVGLRLSLPIAVRHYVNGVLESNGAYTGRVADVDLALWRAGGEVQGLEIVKRNGKVPVPLVEVPRAYASLRWRALLHGKLALDATVVSPALHLVGAPNEEQQQYGVGGRWQETFDALTPIDIDRLTVRDGRAHFHDFHSKPPVDVFLSDISLVAENLTQAGDARDPLPAHARLTATPMTAGQLTVTADFDPLARVPRFEVDTELTGMELAPWNPLLRAYGGIEVRAGSIALYAEADAHEGRFDGYLKPFVADLEVVDVEQEDDPNVFASAWKALVGAASDALKNPRTKKLATRAPLTGTVENPEVEFWPAFVNALRNAFVEAYAPRLENARSR